MTDTLIARANVLTLLPSADELLAKRADVARRLAQYRALYGGNGYAAERQLKTVEARVSAGERARLLACGGKVTEGAIEEATRQHPEYIQALTTDLKQREEWIELEESLAEIEWRLRCRQTDGALLSAEARLSGIAQ